MSRLAVCLVALVTLSGASGAFPASRSAHCHSPLDGRPALLAAPPGEPPLLLEKHFGLALATPSA